MPKHSPLADARKASLLSQSEMADRIGVSQMTISNIERRYPNVRLSQLKTYYGALEDQGKKLMKGQVNDFLYSDMSGLN